MLVCMCGAREDQNQLNDLQYVHGEHVWSCKVCGKVLYEVRILKPVVNRTILQAVAPALSC